MCVCACVSKMEHPVLTAPPLVVRRNEIEPTCCVNTEKLCMSNIFDICILF